MVRPHFWLPMALLSDSLLTLIPTTAWSGDRKDGKGLKPLSAGFAILRIQATLQLVILLFHFPTPHRPSPRAPQLPFNREILLVPLTIPGMFTLSEKQRSVPSPPPHRLTLHLPSFTLQPGCLNRW